MFAKLAEWVKQAVYRIVVEQIQADFESAGYTIEPPEVLLLAADSPAAKAPRKRKS